MNKKTKEILLRIIKEHGDATITVIMKTCYLIDLTAKRRPSMKTVYFEKEELAIKLLILAIYVIIMVHLTQIYINLF